MFTITRYTEDNERGISTDERSRAGALSLAGRWAKQRDTVAVFVENQEGQIIAKYAGNGYFFATADPTEAATGV